MPISPSRVDQLRVALVKDCDWWMQHILGWCETMIQCHSVLHLMPIVQIKHFPFSISWLLKYVDIEKPVWDTEYETWLFLCCNMHMWVCNMHIGLYMPSVIPTGVSQRVVWRSKFPCGAPQAFAAAMWFARGWDTQSCILSNNICMHACMYNMCANRVIKQAWCIMLHVMRLALTWIFCLDHGQFKHGFGLDMLDFGTSLRCPNSNLWC